MWTTKCKIITHKTERITSVSLSVSPVSKALINKRVKIMSTKRQIQRQNAKVFYRYTFPTALMGTAGRSPRTIYHDLGGGDFGTYLSNSGTQKEGAS